MPSSSSPEQKAFDETLAQTTDVLEDLAAEALTQAEAGLLDPNRDDVW